MLKRCLFCTKSKVEDMVSGGELINHSETFRVAHASTIEKRSRLAWDLRYYIFCIKTAKKS